MLAFTSIYQFPMVGSDVCGFGSDTTEELCARWASLGAFYPFYRNHNDFGAIDQEFYRWASVTESAKKAIDIRYRMLDYMYTTMYRATVDGSPVLNPLFYLYPEDKASWALELQYFYGQGLMVAPITEEGATSVDVYLPSDLFYDWYTHEAIQGAGAIQTFSDYDTTSIPLLIRAGVIMPLRVASANTTTDLRQEDFELLIPADADGKATGELYVDDGVSIDQGNDYTLISFAYDNGELTIKGKFGYEVPKIAKVTVLGDDCDATAKGKGCKRRNIEISLDKESTTKVV